ncbi:NADH-quinone oxidoreductase subunit H [Acidisphaera sp. L21]|uniref:NADH-quinone oxidoreductase subunit H n=1 Tax=Acidisphaera sp. L21 TaxID=1641851 RepID=UPI00131C716F|nr:NADH-quinone oxidoreductase subunit H [Acidisphaera sp. L21]
MSLAGILALLVHAVLMAGMAVLLAGVLPWAQARLAGRVGPPVLQPLQDWRRLMRKQPVVSEGASALLPAAPTIQFAMVAAAALLVPSFALGMATAPMSDLLVIAGLLGLARFIMALAAIDAGTAPAGLAAIRSIRLAALAEPALLLVIFTIALLTSTTNLDAAVLSFREAIVPGVPLLLAIAGLASVVVAVEAEGDAALTEFSGWHAAAAEAAVALRRVVWLSLTAALLLPGGLALPGGGLVEWTVGLVAWVLKLGVLGLACALVGPSLRRAGQAAVGPLMGAAVLLGLLAVLFLFAAQGLT